MHLQMHKVNDQRLAMLLMVILRLIQKTVNGGQLHEAKTELNKNIADTKTELNKNIGDTKTELNKISLTLKLNSTILMTLRLN